MKRLLATLGLALLVSIAFGVSVASASHSDSDDPNKDLVSGGGQLSFPSGSPSDFTNAIRVDATSAPDGEDAQGQVFMQVGARVWGKVTCLTVTDNVAWVGGKIVRSQVAPWDSFLIGIQDNGDGNQSDTATFLLVRDAPAELSALLESCSIKEIQDYYEDLGISLSPDNPVKGNFIVHNATP